jgi:hypothetical protein
VHRLVPRTYGGFEMRRPALPRARMKSEQ